MSKILINGGAGFIGYNCATYFKNQGYEVDVIDNLERSSLLGHTVSSERLNFNMNHLKDAGINFYRLDVSDSESFNNFDGHDIIIHLAAQAGVPTSIQNPKRDFEVNAIGTFNTLEYARKYNSAVVYASTNKVYPIHHGFVLNEDSRRWEFENPFWRKYGFPVDNSLVGARTPYGTSKYTGDLLCQEYSHTYGIRTGVFRMSCIFGPSQFGYEEQGWAVYFSIATLKGWPITIFGDGYQVRDMLYVDDCVKAYDAFIKADIHHGVWNLGGGVDNTTSLMEHIDSLERLTGKRSEIRFEDWRPLDQRIYISDIRPIQNELGWKPKVGPEEGLRLSTKWVEENIDVF